MLVRTLRRHHNSCGDTYTKNPGKLYDHPSPQRLIVDGLVERVTPASRKKTANAEDDEG